MPYAQKKQLPPERKKVLRKDRLEARVAHEQKSLFQRAADLQGKTLTEFLIHSAQLEALRIIGEYEIIKLGKEDQRIFMDALLNYEVPNEALRSAAKKYRETHKP